VVRYLFLLTLLPALLAVGCFPMVDCTTEARSSVTVRVFDTSGIPLADAAVTYTADGSEGGQCESFDGDYICGWEVSGDIEIQVEVEGFYQALETVTVEKDVCHVIGETLEIIMQPADCPEVELPSVTVTVVDPDGVAVLDSTVAYSPECEDWFAPQLCDQMGPNEFVCGWDYTCPLYIDAIAAGYEPVSVIVDPDEDVCGPINTPHLVTMWPYLEDSSS